MIKEFKKKFVTYHNNSVDQRLLKANHKKIMLSIKQKQKTAIENYTFSGKEQVNNRVLTSFQKKYIGERCFIVGNGPSLTTDDLNMLKNEITFGANRIYRVFDKTDWRPTFYCTADDAVPNDKEIPEYINSSNSTVFLPKKFFSDTFTNDNICYYDLFDSRKLLKHPKFSDNANKGLYAIGTILYICIQLAVYMGFSEIYLIGVDCSYGINMDKKGRVISKNSSGTDYSKIFGNTKSDSGPHIVSEMEIAFTSAKKFADKHDDINIFNATRGGNLEVFERKNLNHLIT